MSQPFKKRLTLGMILMALMMCVAFMLPISSFQTSAQSPSPLGAEPSIFTFTPTAEGHQAYQAVLFEIQAKRYRKDGISDIL